MRSISTCAAVASLFVVFAACGPKADPSAQQQPAMAPTAGAPYGYPQQQQPGAYPTATAGYPQQGAPQQPYPTATAMPTAAPPAAPGQMATPGPLALPCSNDVACGTHHCNTQYAKCAFPCQGAADCISPNACVMGLCVPQMPGAAPAH